MAGTNKNYTLGKGKVYFDPFVPGTTAGHGEMYFSQTPDFSYSVKTDVLDHYDADEGLNVLDDQILTKVDVTGKLTTDDISEDKLALFLLSDGATNNATLSGSNLADTFIVKRGRYLQLGSTASNPTGVRNVTVTKVALSSAPTVALTPLTNYTVDAALGRVYILPLAAGIVDNNSIIVTYDVAASTRKSVVSKTQQIRGALRFVSTNPSGTQRDYFFPLVNLQPEGDIALKGAEFQKISFGFTALKLGDTERVFIDGRPAT